MTRAEKIRERNATFDPLVGHPHRNAILAVMCLSLIVIVLDNSILNVAIPTISQELGASDKDLLWIIDSYTLVFAGLLLTAGTLGDKFGRRKALQIGLLIFGVASLVATFADSPTQLIIGRGLMGIGGAAIMPATLSIITNVFPPKERARAIGIWAAFAGIGGAIGPLTGGFLIEHFWWGSVFLVNIPVVIVAVVTIFLIVPESRDANAPKVDIFGAALSIVALTSLLYAIIIGAEEGYSHPNIVAAFVISAISFAVFFFWEAKIDEPMLQLSFFKDRRFSSGALSITLIFFAMFGMSLLLTQYMQLVLGYSPLQSGVAFIPFALTMFITAPTSAKLAQKFGTKTIVVLGLTLVAIALFAMSTLQADEPYSQLMWMFIMMAAGMGFTMAPSTSAIMNSLPREKAGVGSAMNDTTRMVGAALGLAIIGSVFSNIYRSNIESNSDLDNLENQFLASGASKEETTTLFSDIADSVGKAIGRAQAILDPTKIPDPEVQARINAIPEGTRKTVGETVTTAAQDSFMQGMHAGMRTAAVAVLIAIVIAAIWMPQQSMSEDQEAGIAH
jgi:EmrB/QacA subfamily drug resistance transporter